MVPAGDCSGLEGLPLKLMIVSVVAALSVIPAADALDTLRDRAFADRCVLQLDQVVSIAQIVSMEGTGASRVLRLDFRSEGALSMQSLSIGGGAADPYMASVVMELSSGMRLIRSAEEPFVWMASEGLEAVTVNSAVFDLRMAASCHEGIGFVECEVL